MGFLLVGNWVQSKGPPRLWRFRKWWFDIDFIEVSPSIVICTDLFYTGFSKWRLRSIKIFGKLSLYDTHSGKLYFSAVGTRNCCEESSRKKTIDTGPNRTLDEFRGRSFLRRARALEDVENKERWNKGDKTNVSGGLTDVTLRQFNWDCSSEIDV